MNENDLLYTFAKEHMIQASGLLALLMPQAFGLGIGIKGVDGRYLLVNKAMETLLGKHTDEIVSMADSDLFPAKIADKLQHYDQQILDGAMATSDELDLFIDGSLIRCLWLKFPVIGPEGSVLFIGTMLLDTSRQEEIANLRQSLERLQHTNHELQKNLVELDCLASTDKLTGAWNRRRLEETVVNEMERLRRYDHPLSLLILDIDFFKQINDQHGHLVGDEILAELAGVIQSTIRTTDSLTRWGGEEFIVLSPNTTLTTMALLAERLRKKIANTSFLTVSDITVSLGVAECMAGENWAQWFRRADAALYCAKAGGRNQVQIAPETRKHLGHSENVAANFVQLSWHTAYECGNTLVDDQHRNLFLHTNNLLAAILSPHPTEEVSQLIETLMHAIVQHFKDEEAIFTVASFPGAAEHAAIHQQLVDSATALINRFNAGTLAIGELFQFLAHDVVAKHMLGADREFFPYLNTQS